MMLGCSRLASSQHASTSQKKSVHSGARVHHIRALRNAGTAGHRAVRLERQEAVAMGTPEVAARAADRPPQLPSTDEALLFADIEVNAAASPHSAEYKEFVETQLEVVGHAFGNNALNIIVYLRTTESFVSESAERLRLTRVASWPPATKSRAAPWASEGSAMGVSPAEELPLPASESDREPYKKELMLFSSSQQRSSAGTLAYSESLLLSQRAVQLSTGSLVIPMSREGVLLGLVVAERNALTGRPAWAPSGAPWTPGTSANPYPSSPWPMSAETFSGSQKRSLQSVATSLSLVWAMDQKNKGLLRSTAQTRTQLSSYISEARKPLAAIRTLGGILERQFRPGEAPRDLATAIQEQGTQLSDLAADLQVALYSETGAGLLPEPGGGQGPGQEQLRGGFTEGAPALGPGAREEQPREERLRQEGRGEAGSREEPPHAIDAEATPVHASASVTDVTPTEPGPRIDGSGDGDSGRAGAVASTSASDPPSALQQQRQPAAAEVVTTHADPKRVTHPRPHSASEQCSIPSVLRPLLGAMDGIARSSRVTLVADVPEDRNREEPFTALASSREVKRVLSLMLETALQQTPPGGRMEVRVSRQRTLEGSAVVVEVVCRTSSGAHAQAAGSTGWVADGLALASSLAAEMGGSVLRGSESGRGTEARALHSLAAAGTARSGTSRYHIQCRDRLRLIEIMWIQTVLCRPYLYTTDSSKMTTARV